MGRKRDINFRMFINYADLTVVRDVVIAMFAGGLLGYEREMANKPAGFRTHMLVAGAAALLVGLGDPLLERYVEFSKNEMLRADPIRIVEAVITGISFLGAGTIFRRGGSDHVEGLTTAASLLLVGAIGMAVALQRYLLSASVVVIALLVLRGIGRLEKR